MNDSPLSQENVDNIFSQLKTEDVDQFYRGYQRWRFQRRIDALREQIDALQQRIAANREAMQQSAPSPMALASLARMQSRGVQDTDLLNRLLERGEEWLDRTIQRLEYCEQTGLIGDNYTKWCEHALEGAYDWIDSLTGANSAAPTQQFDTRGGADQEADASEPLPQTTEAMLLQKLMSEEDEITIKHSAVPPTPVLPETDAVELSDAPPGQIVAEEPATLAAPEPEIVAQGETIQPPGDEQHISEEEYTSLEESAASATEFSSESEAAVIADEGSEPHEATQENVTDESSMPDEVTQTQTAITDESSAPDEAAQVDNVQGPAPSEQYDFPVDFDDLPPITTQASPARDNLPPSEEAVAPAVADIPTVVQPTATPVRPRRKRNFLQKLIYVLTGR